MLDHGSQGRAVASLNNSQQFDFGSGMPLPPPTARHHAAVDGGVYIKQEDDLFHSHDVSHAHGRPVHRVSLFSHAAGAALTETFCLTARLPQLLTWCGHGAPGLPSRSQDFTFVLK